MKIIRSLTFTAGFLILIMLITPFFVPKDENPYAKDKSPSFNGIFSEADHSLDLLFAGDSESYANFMPMEFWAAENWKSYNIGVPSLNVQESSKVLFEILEKQNPQVLVIETNNFFKEIGDWTSTINHTFTSKLNQYFPLFNYHDNWKQLAAFKNPEAVSTARNPLKGWRYNNKTVPFEGSVNLKPTDKQRELSALNEEIITDMVKKAQERGIEVIFVSAPSAKNWSYKRHNTIDALANKLAIKHLDLNLLQDELGLDWKQDTYDKGDHVNYKGAQKVSQYMIDYLKENTALQKTASDKEVVEWNQDLIKYRTTIRKK